LFALPSFRALVRAGREIRFGKCCRFIRYGLPLGNEFGQKWVMRQFPDYA